MPRQRKACRMRDDLVAVCKRQGTDICPQVPRDVRRVISWTVAMARVPRYYVRVIHHGGAQQACWHVTRNPPMKPNSTSVVSGLPGAAIETRGESNSEIAEVAAETTK